jgi:hypothetical protein
VRHDRLHDEGALPIAIVDPTFTEASKQIQLEHEDRSNPKRPAANRHVTTYQVSRFGRNLSLRLRRR